MILATDSAGKSGGETTVSLPCGAPAVTVGLKVRASGALRPKYTEIRREAFLASAESYGLTNFEAALPFTPAYLTTEDERRAVMALLRIRGGCFTLPLLQSTVSGCGLTATIEEGTEAMTAVIRFPQNRGVPDGFEKLQKRIEEIVPCHLQTTFVFIYALWQELTAGLASWSAAQSLAGTWKAMETYI